MVYCTHEPDECERAGDEGRRRGRWWRSRCSSWGAAQRRPCAGDADVRPDERDVQCVLVRIKGG